MTHHAKASSAGPTKRQAGRPGRFFRGALATRASSGGAKGSGAPSLRLLGLAVAALALVVALLAPALASAAVPKHPFTETFGSANQPNLGSPSPLELAVNQSNGDLYVIEGAEESLSRWKPDGTPDNFSSLGTNKLTGIAFGAANENQVAVDSSNGKIYVVSIEEGLVKIFNSDGSSAGTLTKSSTGNFGEPCGVAVDSTGHVYVAEAAGKIDKFANPPVSGTTEEEIPVASEEPCNIAVGSGPSAGYVFAAGYTSGIFKVSSSSEQKIVSAKATTLSVDPGTGHLYVGLAFSAQVKEYAVSGASAEEVSSTAIPSAARGLATNWASGNLYVARGSSNTVEVFGPIAGHHFTETFGSANQPNLGSPSPLELAVNQSNGDLYVIEGAEESVSRWKPDGTPDNFSSLGTNKITGIAFGSANENQVAVDSSNGKVYVVSIEEGLVKIYNSNGSSAGTLTKSSTGNFGEPCGVAVDSTGHVYVAEAAGKIDKFANPPVSGTTEEEIPVAGEEPCNIAVGSGPSTGYVFAAGYTSGIFKVSGTSEEEIVSAKATTLSVDPGSGHLYAGLGFSAEVKEYNVSGATVEEVSSTAIPSAARGLATNWASGDLYVARGSSSTVGVYGPGPGLHSITITVTGNGKVSQTAASTTSTPAASGSISNCTSAGGANCSAEYFEGEEPEFEAPADPNNHLVEWTVQHAASTTCAGAIEKCKIKIGTENVAAKAEFKVSGFEAKVEKQGSGTGTIESDVAGINSEKIICGPHCAELFTPATPVVLSASADPHGEFNGWTGGDCEEEPSPSQCKVTMGAAKTVHATFTRFTHALTVIPSGSGKVSAEASPAPVSGSIANCEEAAGSCNATYNEPETVTLVATPAAHFQLAGWGGGECKAEPAPGKCEVEMSAAKEVHASFTRITHNLKIIPSGAGKVSAEASPAPVSGSIANCEEASGSCNATYNEPETVTLVATPSLHFQFAGWGGGECKAEPSPGKCEVEMSAAKEVHASFTKITHALTVVPSGAGKVSAEASPAPVSGSISNCEEAAGSCQATYNEPETVTLVATPAANFEFSGWGGGECKAEPSGKCEVEMSSAKEVHASFTPEAGQVTLGINVTGEGQVKCNGSACEPSYAEGTSLTLEPLAGPHAAFAGFSGGTGSAVSCSGTGNCSFTIEANSTVNAAFPLIQRTLTIEKAGSGNGSFECKTTGSFGACSASYADGTTITVKATPDSHSTFVSWAGCSSTTANECTVSAINANTTVTATFNLASRTLTIAKAGTGNGSFECKTTGSFGACNPTYTDGETIVVKATPDSHSTFASWAGCSSTTANECTITSINANTAVTATFNLAARTLTIAKSGTGNGSFDCKTTGSFGACNPTYTDGETITIKAVPDSHSTFASWVGCSSTTGNECTVSAINANTTVTATLNLAQRTLTINKAGTGNGSFECKTTGSFGACLATYADGETITVKATPDSHSTFVSWAGCSSTSTNECTVSAISANKTVTATMNLASRTLTVSKAGTGNGSLECKTTGSFGACNPTYTDGETIVVKATANSHSTFAGWAGCSSSAGNECTVAAINANTTVTATFNLASRSLTINKSGTGNGSFECKTTGSFGACNPTYTDGETIVVKALPDSHSTFVSWTGCSSTTGNECTITTISANKTVTASFSALQRTLTIAKAGSGSGSVSCDGGACASSYADGTKVTLSATAASGSSFAGWSGGGCSGTGSCVVTLEANTTVTATFNASSPPPPPPPPPAETKCVVPKLAGKSLGQAKSALKTAGCALGKVTKPKKAKGALVVKSSKPGAGASLAAGAKVELKLGPKPKHKK